MDPDPDPYVFGPPGSVSHKYGSGSRSFHHHWFLLLCDFFMTFYQCSESVGSVCFGSPISAYGSANGSVRQRYGSEDPDPQPYQNVTGPQHGFLPLSNGVETNPLTKSASLAVWSVHLLNLSKYSMRKQRIFFISFLLFFSHVTIKFSCSSFIYHHDSGN